MGKREGGTRTKGVYRESTHNRPLISVVTVVLNGGRHLEQTIRSVIDQTYENIEYIIIDGGSTDASLDIIARYDDRIDYWVSEPDDGIYEAMNKGIELARGELIGILNSDDFYELDAIAAVVEKFLTMGTLHVLYGNTYVLFPGLGLKNKSYAHTCFWRGMGCYHPAMFVHKECYRKIGKYDTSYRFASDYDFMLRAVQRNAHFGQVDKFLANYRNSGFSEIYRASTLEEVRTINRKYYGFFSFGHCKYLLLFFRSMLFLFIKGMIKFLFGERALRKVWSFYFRKVLSKDCIYIQ